MIVKKKISTDFSSVIAFCELLHSKLEMLKMAAKFTDAFNFFPPLERWLVTCRKSTIQSYLPGMGRVCVNFFKLGFIAVLQLSLAYYSKCHSNLLTLRFINKAKLLFLVFFKTSLSSVRKYY